MTNSEFAEIRNRIEQLQWDLFRINMLQNDDADSNSMSFADGMVVGIQTYVDSVQKAIKDGSLILPY